MPSLPISVIILVSLVTAYIYPLNPFVILLMMMVLTGLSFSYTAIKGGFLIDLSWAVLLSGAVFNGLKMLLPTTVSMLAALSILLVILGILASRKGVDKFGEWPGYAGLTVGFLGVIGALVNSEYIVWIVMAPLIEVFILGSGVVQGNSEKFLVALYYIVIYTVALSLDPYLIIYALFTSVLRLVKPKLLEFKYLPIDSSLRLILWYGCISLGC